MKLFFGLISLGLASSFMTVPQTFRRTRQVVFISEEVANFVDEQYWRQNHKKELEDNFQEKNKMMLEKELPTDFDFDDHIMEENLSTTHLERDKRMARDHPMAYCADRCIATGHCDVFEDVFELSPTDVMKFCENCVLSDSEEPCDVPESYLEDGYKKLKP
mmetsp:Transcript_13825/g.21366  ORF Transcript_13825/g.21366 Transcript_13825/m.21366 type:complete len:161 (+) Transcript_13825:66-548(+)